MSEEIALKNLKILSRHKGNEYGFNVESHVADNKAKNEIPRKDVSVLESKSIWICFLIYRYYYLLTFVINERSHTILMTQDRAQIEEVTRQEILNITSINSMWKKGQWNLKVDYSSCIINIIFFLR